MSMDAQLVALAGPLQGSVLPLREDEISIGRDAANALRLEDRAVSRRHCVIVRENGQYRIRDMQSANRTRVNGLPVEEQGLEHRDEIGIGRSVFLFLAEADEALSSRQEVAWDEGASGLTFILKREGALYLHPQEMVDEVARPGNAAHALKCMLQVSAAVSAARSVGDLAGRVLPALAEAFPADRGALILGRRWDELEAAYYRNWRARTRTPFAVSQPVIRRLWEERVGVRVQEAAAEPGRGPIAAVLAVPLIWGEAVLGAIYLDTADACGRFAEEDLQLLAGIAAVSAAPLENALRVERLEAENRRLEAELHGEYDMVGASAPMREVYQFVRKAAPTNATVLILGESGTGKELLARAIHRNSPRADKPFVAINCAAVTETLLESEFFGHEKGAFTGAVAARKGKLEQADGGSIFLDEIGELAPALQAKLLRVLQEREFERVGGTRPVRVDIRLIAATNRKLEEAVRQGTFRQDLYYRLNVVAVTMPPLRERQEDIPVLAHHFLQKRGAAATRKIAGISEAAQACLRNYDWPGNVRELENAIERAIVLGTTEEILREDLPDSIGEAGQAAETGGAKFHETVREWKRQLVLKALEEARQNHAAAARLLGLHPNNLYRLLKSLNLKTG